jgi:hypothetical protein
LVNSFEETEKYSGRFTVLIPRLQNEPPVLIERVNSASVYFTEQLQKTRREVCLKIDELAKTSGGRSYADDLRDIIPVSTVALFRCVKRLLRQRFDD